MTIGQDLQENVNRTSELIIRGYGLLWELQRPPEDQYSAPEGVLHREYGFDGRILWA